jgi:hypothetical protein
MLKLLLDEHISRHVSTGLRRRNRLIEIFCMSEWEEGTLGQDDSVCLHAAALRGLTVVTYDRRTIPPLLKDWAEQERDHGGVIFVDERTIAPSDIGGLVMALNQLANETENLDWMNRVFFLRR